MMIRTRTVAIAAGALAAAGAAAVGTVSWIGARRAMHPKRIVERHALEHYEFALRAEVVRFLSLDGTALAAWYLPCGRMHAPSVVLAHGYGNSRPQLLPHAEYLHRHGYNVLLPDLRNRGESGGAAVTVAALEQLDIRAAVAWLADRPEVDPERIAVQGVSMGASAAILAMAKEPRIRALVSESAFTDLGATVARSFKYFIGLPSFPFAPVAVWFVEQRVGARAVDVRPVAAIRRIGARAVLVIEDSEDVIIPHQSGRRLYAAAPGPKDFWLIEGAGHAQGYYAQPEEYERRVLAFYARHLPAGPSAPDHSES